MTLDKNTTKRTYFVLSISLVIVFGVLTSPNFLQQFDVYGGGQPIKRTPLVNMIGENDVVVDFADENSDGYIGQLMENAPTGTQYSVEKITFFLLDGSVSDGDITGVILNNVSEGSSIDDVVEIATTEIITLGVAPFDNDSPVTVTFNFSTPINLTLDGSDFIGFKIEGTSFVEFPMYVFNDMGDLEGTCFVVPDLTGENWDTCSNSLSVDDLAMEILISDTPELFETTGGIEPSKLVVHLTFDEEQLNDVNIIDGSGGDLGVNTTFSNAGTFSSDADATRFLERVVSNTEVFLNTTGLLGESWRLVDPDSVAIIGSEANKDQFSFLHNNEIETWSINFWIRQTPDNFFEDVFGDIVFLNTINGEDDNGIAIYTRQDNFGLYFVNGGTTVINVGTFGGTQFGGGTGDADWHMLTVIVEKHNVTSFATTCIDLNCDSVDPDGSFDETNLDGGSLFIAEVNEATLGPFILDKVEYDMDELCIWKDYKLTSSDRATLYNSGNGAVCGTVVASGGGSPDIDNDGIFNEVDLLPSTFSDDFDDTPIGGTSDGKIEFRGDQILTITEEANPDGVRAKADISGGAAEATVEFCSGMSSIDFAPGDEIVVTCSSVTVTVINGQPVITFISTDDTEATTTLTAGNSITFDQDTFSFTAPATNTETVIISVNGEDTPVDPGSSVSIPLQTAHPDSGPTTPIKKWADGIGAEPCNDSETFNCVDESIQDDSDYIQTIGLGKNGWDKQFYTLSDMTDPLTSDGHVLKYTISEADLGTNPVELDVELRQGLTVIASFHHENLPSEFTLIEQTLTAAQADSITNYSDLELTFHGNCDATCKNSPGNREKIQVSWIEFAIMASP